MSFNINNQLLSYAPISYIGKEPLKINKTPVVDGEKDPECIDLSNRLDKLVRSIPSRPAKTSTKGPRLGEVPKEDLRALVELNKRHIIAQRDNVKPFPKRTIAIAERVGKLSTDKLRALSVNSFMQIVDLISKEKAKDLLSDPKLPLARRAALKTFNPHVGTENLNFHLEMARR